MNAVALIGRLAADPDIRATQDTTIVRYTIAVQRRKEETDFIRCVTFGKSAEFAEKYLHKGMKIGVTGRILTGSYKDKDGKTVYTTEVVVNDHEFCESRDTSSNAQNAPLNERNGGRQENVPSNVGEGFMSLPEGLNDEKLPWN